MSATTALFVGGPWDGRLEVLQRDRVTVAVAEPTRARYVASIGPDGPEPWVSFRSSHYRREGTSLFGVRIDVWVHESLHGREKDKAVARLLLSSLAKGLARGAFDA